MNCHGITDKLYSMNLARLFVYVSCISTTHAFEFTCNKRKQSLGSGYSMTFIPLCDAAFLRWCSSKPEYVITLCSLVLKTQKVYRTRMEKNFFKNNHGYHHQNELSFKYFFAKLGKIRRPHFLPT